MPVLPFPKINNGVEPKPIETLTEAQLAESLMISIKTLQRWRLEGGGHRLSKSLGVVCDTALTMFTNG